MVKTGIDNPEGFTFLPDPTDGTLYVSGPGGDGLKVIIQDFHIYILDYLLSNI